MTFTQHGNSHVNKVLKVNFTFSPNETCDLNVFIPQNDLRKQTEKHKMKIVHKITLNQKSVKNSDQF